MMFGEWLEKAMAGDRAAAEVWLAFPKAEEDMVKVREALIEMADTATQYFYYRLEEELAA